MALDASLDWYEFKAIAPSHRSETLEEYPPLPFAPVTSIRYGNYTYKTGKCAEMRDGSFLRIKSMHTDLNGNVWLKGDCLVRMNLQGFMMPKRRNELIWMRITDDVTNAESLLVSRKLVDTLRIRRLNFTNETHKTMNIKTHAKTFRNPYEDVEMGELFCRTWRTPVVSARNKGIEDSIENLPADEADKDHRAEARRLRDEWRGFETVPGGSFTCTYELITVDGECETIPTRKPSFGDAFCGGGGFTRGAFMAGLQPVFGFDYDKNAVITYRANFVSKGTQCLLESVDEFLLRVSQLKFEERKFYMVDVLHISSPCPPFSSANTRPNEEMNATNQAAMFSILQLIQTLKPRIVTVEQTDGITKPAHKAFFDALLNMFVTVNYSVRWKVLNCKNFGVPQPRKRLMLLAAAPGEKLPNFPAATHGERPGLKPLVTIQDTLSSIPASATRQETSTPTHRSWPKAAFSPETLAKTVTCDGGPGNYHPSGTRNYTVRELASLQTFPSYHEFPGTGLTAARRQIGNAVPPRLAERMCREIIKTLKETDADADAVEGMA